MKALFLIGIGGSNLGTVAVIEALQGKMHNELRDKKVYFADTCDSEDLADMHSLMKSFLDKGEKVLINVISKSGGTTETLTNFSVLEDCLLSYKDKFPNIFSQIVATTEKDSKLYNYAKGKGYSCLEMPSSVGGRYSVLSTVGLFPLCLMDVNCKELLEGAKEMAEFCLEEQDPRKNPAMALSAALYEQKQENKISIVNSFFFLSRLESLGKWYRQLLAESTGKEKNRKGDIVHSGYTPTTCIGSTDLHSIAQLHLGGPNDTFHSFIRVANLRKVQVPDNKELEAIVHHTSNRPVSEILDAIYIGIREAFLEKKRPLSEIVLNEVSEKSLGAYMQLMMMEVMYLGALEGINPFDQPNVEDYKVITKKELEQR